MTLRELTMTVQATRARRPDDAGTAAETRDLGVAARPAGSETRAVGADLIRLFGLDRLPTYRQPLVCHWRRGADGRLFCVWTRDTKPAQSP